MDGCYSMSSKYLCFFTVGTSCVTMVLAMGGVAASPPDVIAPSVRIIMMHPSAEVTILTSTDVGTCLWHVFHPIIQVIVLIHAGGMSLHL